MGAETPAPTGPGRPAGLIVEGCAVATMDGAATEFASGHVVVEGNRIVAVGAGPAGDERYAPGAWTRIDGRGCLATPGLVNVHHHLYQGLTAGMAPQADLFAWLTELYPVWAHLDAEMLQVAVQAGLARLATGGCTTAADHHYVFPPAAGDLLAAEVEAAAGIGLRFHPCRGSMDLGRSSGGLPPDHLVEDRDAVLAACEQAIARFHDPAPGAMVRLALAPCSPFSATRELMAETATLARRHGVRLHTHLAETATEQAYCRRRHDSTLVDYLDEVGWLGPDVWLAHCVHLDAVDRWRLAGTGTGVAHCPSSNARLGAGLAPVAALRTAGVPVGLGVDGTASNEAGSLDIELRQALLTARLRDGAAALTPRDVLAMATIGGARCLGRDGELGSLEAGKLADVALWRLDGLGHAGFADPVAALVMGPPAPVELLLVGGRAVVEGGELRTAAEDTLAGRLRAASGRMRDAILTLPAEGA